MFCLHVCLVERLIECIFYLILNSVVSFLAGCDSHTSSLVSSKQDLLHRPSSPVLQLNGQASLSNGAPPTTTVEEVTCRSCDEEKSSISQVGHVTSNGVENPYSGCVTEKCPSNSDCVELVDKIAHTWPPHQTIRHSASEGNVLRCRQRTNAFSYSSAGYEWSSTENIRMEDYECPLSPHSECDDLDYFNNDKNNRGRAITMPEREATPPRMLSKKMRVTRGLSKTAKFFSMLTNRHRSSISTSVGGGIGETVNTQCMSNVLSGHDMILMNGTRSGPDSENANNVLNSVETYSLNTTSTTNARKVNTHYRRSSEGLKKRRGTETRYNGMLGANLPPSGFQEGRILSGSLEGLLSAIDAELPSKRGSNSGMGWKTGGMEGGGRMRMVRSPSLFGLKSFDDEDGYMGSAISLSCSFSSRSLETFLEQKDFDAELTPNCVHRPHELNLKLSPHPVFEDAESAVTCVLGSTDLAGTCDVGGMRGEGAATRSPSNSSVESSGKSFTVARSTVKYDFTCLCSVLFTFDTIADFITRVCK